MNKNLFSWIWDLTGWTPLSANELLVVEWREQTQQPSISTAVCLTLVCFGCFKLIPVHPQVLIHQIKAGYQNLAFLSFMYVLEIKNKLLLRFLFVCVCFNVALTTEYVATVESTCGQIT